MHYACTSRAVASDRNDCYEQPFSFQHELSSSFFSNGLERAFFFPIWIHIITFFDHHAKNAHFRSWGDKCLPPPFPPLFLFSQYIYSLAEKRISRTFLYNIAFQLTLKSKSLKKTRKTEERKSRADPQLYKFAIPLPSSSDRELPGKKESLRKIYCDPPSTMKYVPALSVSF